MNDGRLKLRNISSRSMTSGLPNRRSLLGALSIGLLLPAASAQQLKVTISGGADGTGQNYWWAVTNHHSSPVVYVQFPQYHADTFHAPEGWNKESTYMVKLGVPDRPGTCTASVDSPRNGIATGRSAEFGVRLARVGAHRRPGEVIVRFADGTEAIVAGVEVPTAPTTPERLVALIGFALIFGIMVLVRMRRRRKARAATQPDAAAGAGDE